MADALHVDVEAWATASSLLREVRFRRDAGGAEIRVLYEIFDGATRDYPNAWDGFLFGALLFLMKSGLPVRVHGPLSRSAMQNLEEVQAFWRMWRPSVYGQVEIVPDRIVDLERSKPGRRAIAGFSGGVDSTFTVLRHRTGLSGAHPYNLDAVLMVHGFDIDFVNRDDFARAAERARPFLAKMGVALRTARTTLKESNLQNWEDSHACQLASCLHQFSDEFEFGMIASTASYANPELPYGSNPVVDHLLSGDAMSLVYDGAGSLKTEKVAAIAKDPVAMAGLRFCWEGKDQSRNCGRCSKCVRTRLMFLLAGVQNPACFDEEFEDTMVDAMRVEQISAWARLGEIAAAAERQGVKAPWVRKLQRKMATYRRQALIERQASWAGPALDRMGMRGVVKRTLRTFGLLR